MNIFQYYSQHSEFTSPGDQNYLFNTLDDEISSLCSIIQKLFLHYADEEIYQFKIPKIRYQEMNTRYVENILKVIISYDADIKNSIRSVQNRMIGVCRDNAILLCSILRNKNIPSRLRTGFVDFVIPGMYLDGFCVEYWNQEKNRWCLVEARITQDLINKLKLNLNFSLHDIPEEKFVSAARAWKLCRAQKINSNRFGSRMHRGLWYVRNRLLQDFVLLNKYEVLIWDIWGMMLSPVIEYEKLDELADFVMANAYDINKIRLYYQSNPHFQVSDTILVDNPFCEPMTFVLRS